MAQVRHQLAEPFPARLRCRPPPHDQTRIVTQKRDLRSGRPVWLDTARIGVACRRACRQRSASTSSSSAPAFSGAMLAYRLRRRGSERARRRPPRRRFTAAPRRAPRCCSSRSTRRSFELARRRSAATRRNAPGGARSRRSTMLRRLVKREKIDCGWRDCNVALSCRRRIRLRALRRWRSKARAAAGVAGDIS